ncbi:hypothetical protein PUN28_005639 [Cardiocondyla obscurior]|uniref:Uncharacterized protein n=1 Tax=Cardiocondyla obscurior TaxID=286306 RepID=A0AAW2GIS9_9HYME
MFLLVERLQVSADRFTSIVPALSLAIRSERLRYTLYIFDTLLSRPWHILHIYISMNVRYMFFFQRKKERKKERKREREREFTKN